MSSETTGSNMGFEQKEINKEIVAHLSMIGNDVPANIADDVGQSRQYVHQRLQILEAAGYVENIGRGVYKFTGSGEDAEE